MNILKHHFEYHAKHNPVHLTFMFICSYNSPLWASLVAQLVKNPPAMQETPGQFLGQADPLQKG